MPTAPPPANTGEIDLAHLADDASQRSALGTEEQLLLDAEEAWLAQHHQPPASSTPRIGLALSGGGIRSATFNLGVLQVLRNLSFQPPAAPPAGVPAGTPAPQRRSLLQHLDYLSTVSGGGYIGSWLVANWWRKAQRGIPEDHQLDFLAPDSPEILHLRRYSRYLAPEDGLLNADTWTMLAIWIRNTLLVQLMVGCWVLAGMLTVRLFGSLLDIFSHWKQGADSWFWQLLVNLKVPQIAATGEMWHRKNGWVCLLLAIGPFIYAWLNMGRELRAINRTTPSPSDRPKKSQFQVFTTIVMPLVVTTFFLAAALLGVLPPYNISPEQLRAALTNYFSPSVSGVAAPDGFGAAPFILFGKGEVAMLFSAMGYFLALSGTTRVPVVHHPPLSWRTLRATIGKWLIIITTALVAGVASHAMARMLQSQIAGGLRYTNGLYMAEVWQSHIIHPILKVSAFRLYLEPVFWSLAFIFLAWKFGRRSPWWMHLLGLLLCAVSFLLAWQGLEWMSHLLTQTLVNYQNVARFYVGPTIAVFGTLFVVAIVGLLGREMNDETREWISRLGAWFMITWATCVAVKILVFHGPDIVTCLLESKDHWAIKWGAVFTWLMGTGAGLLASRSADANGQPGAAAPSPIVRIVSTVGPYIAITGLLLVASWLLNRLVTGGAHSPVDPGWAFPLSAFWWLLGLILAGVVLALRVDLNEFSMNHFYRNRLVRCYLGTPGNHQAESKPHPFTGFNFSDNFPLAELAVNDCRYPGPYPILCGALNTSNDGGLDTQERKAESFIFSPLGCGAYRQKAEMRPNSALHSYRPTALYADGTDAPFATPFTVTKTAPEGSEMTRHQFPGDPLTLGTCMAISGAAVSPNAGYHTSAINSVFLGLFNARLGWWLPNTSHEKTALRQTAAWRRNFPENPLGWLNVLAAELSGSASPVTSFISVSDGGHFENLGIYELVRRRCKVIICSDGEQDQHYQFHGLGTAIRRCRVDFDTEITIDLSQIKERDAKGRNKAPCAIGTIHYPGNTEPGVLIYLKLSFTGWETEDVAQYRSLHPQFPHEPTSNQFFLESQFESYRRLGETVTNEALRACWKAATSSATTHEECWSHFARLLSPYWATPSAAEPGSFSRHTQALISLWRTIRDQRDSLTGIDEYVIIGFRKFLSTQGVDLRKLDQERLKEPRPATATAAAARLRDAAYVCQEMLQLMENIYFDLRLEDEYEHPDNSGWVVLFRQWSTWPVLREAWASTRATYSARFRMFCQVTLRL